MARIVLTSFGSYGDVNPLIGLALALRARAHEPVLALPGAYRQAVEREGLLFHPVRPDVDVGDRRMVARIMDPASGTRVLFKDVLIPSLAESTADLHAAVEGADFLVSHPASLAGPIVAEETTLPWASTALAPVSFFSVHDPMVPAPAPWLHACTSRSPALSRLFQRLTQRVTIQWSEPVRRFRAARGLPAGGNPLMEGQHSPHLVLGLFSRLLGDPQPDWPERVVVTGPILYNGPGPDTLDPALEAFLEAGAPPLVFTLGSAAVAAAGSFYQVSATVAQRLGRRAVLLAGRHVENRPRTIPDGVFIADFARHRALFPQALLTVHQGGAGTLHQALCAGRPMLVVPHSHDQPDNARRARRLGVARTLPARRYRPNRLERELRRLIDEPAYWDRAEDIAAHIHAEPGATGAADAIEKALA